MYMIVSASAHMETAGTKMDQADWGIEIRAERRFRR